MSELRNQFASARLEITHVRNERCCPAGAWSRRPTYPAGPAPMIKTSTDIEVAIISRPTVFRNFRCAVGYEAPPAGLRLKLQDV